MNSTLNEDKTGPKTLKVAPLPWLGVKLKSAREPSGTLPKFI